MLVKEDIVSILPSSERSVLLGCFELLLEVVDSSYQLSLALRVCQASFPQASQPSRRVLAKSSILERLGYQMSR